MQDCHARAAGTAASSWDSVSCLITVNQIMCSQLLTAYMREIFLFFNRKCGVKSNESELEMQSHMLMKECC